MPSEAIITLPGGLTIRPICRNDAEQIAHHANNHKIWINMTERFPFPYTFEEALKWVDLTENKDETWVSTSPPPWYLAEQARPVSEEHLPADTSPDDPQLVRCNYGVCLNDVVIGGVGLEMTKRETFSRHADVGYWIGEEHWGKGFATQVCKAWTQWIFDTFPWLVRVQAKVYSWNPASMAVLKKSGYAQEAVLVDFLWKDGKLLDEHWFVKFKDGRENSRRN